MKQILQDMSKGATTIVESPSPKARKGTLLIATSTSLISAGTERMLVDFGRASLVEKARQQPEKVRMVLDKVRTDGLFTTIDAVRSKLGEPLKLGYCNVGIVEEVGSEVEGFFKGDRVVSNGSHADIVRVPKNLCSKIPSNVSDEQASFTVVASIGLQGVRLVNPTLGESIVVTGVGLIGLITVQLLRAQGCRVLAIDYDDNKLALAKQFGAEICNPGKGDDSVAAGMTFSKGRGVDAVIITASTNSNEPVTQAAQMTRKRGRIVLVGVTGLQLNRADFYEKELTFQVSCSYGPGRYDPNYEEGGADYPLAFVRWTEQRNFEAILDLMASGQLNVEPLITHRFLFEDAPKAYNVLVQERNALGILLQYKTDTKTRLIDMVDLISETEPTSTNVKSDGQIPKSSSIMTDARIGFIGAGNYASRVLIPAFKASGATLHTISTSSGVNGVVHGKRAGFKHATTDTDGLIQNPEIHAVAIVTQHNNHAHFTTKALSAQKHVFVEKPLALTHDELKSVESAYVEGKQHNANLKLMVGFNRRFSPQVQKMKSLLATVSEPKSFIMTMNAGAIPADHWTQNLEQGGGRIIGEACHYIDLMRFLAGSAIISVQARRMGNSAGVAVTEDKASITLGFADGSFGTIHYFANGAASFPKERVEVFSAGKVLQLDNFRKLKGFGWKGFSKMNLWRQDKGQKACSAAFISAIKENKPCPISASEIFEVARVTIEAAEQLRKQD